jgi:peroxiredoxin
MNALAFSIIVLSWLVIGLVFWLGWQLLRQNGRILLRLDELEQRLDESEFGELSSSRPEEARIGKSEIRNPKSEIDGSLVTSAPTTGDVDRRLSRFSNRSLARSKIKRDGLKAGTPAPQFCLPRLDGRGELSMEELRGRRVLLVFSDPHCGPCNQLVPRLEKFHRANSEISIVMISRGEPKENRVKVKGHGLTFPVVLQQHWEVSRLYAMFATPMACRIDEEGAIVHDAAVGVEPILRLMEQVAESLHESAAALR